MTAMSWNEEVRRARERVAQTTDMADLVNILKEVVPFGNFNGSNPDELWPAIRSHVDYKAACRRLVVLPGGIEALYRTIWSIRGSYHQEYILRTLWHAERKELPPEEPDEDPETADIIDVVAREAGRRLRDIFAESFSDSDHFGVTLRFAEELWTGRMLKDDEYAMHIISSLLGTSGLGLTRPLLQQLRDLIDAEEPELTYQTFLSQHPVLLDPLAAEVYDRHRLGDDLITDYVLRRHDGRYLIVEIEKPHDKIFTVSSDFTSRFNHAFGQVLDFMGWVDSNVAYARTKLPGIETPDGLLVIGLRDALTPPQIAKLRRFSMNSRRIHILTFDDILIQGGKLYSSLQYGSY